MNILFSAVSVGTERAVLLGLPNAVRSMPFYPGYSGSGIVASVGRGVHELRPGDLVAGQLGHASYGVANASRLVQFEGRAFAPMMAFVELGCIVQQAIRKARIRLGESVAIVGSGLLGQILVLYAHCLGSGDITLIGRRERDGSALGLPIASSYIVGSGPDSPEINGLAADVVIEAAGNAAALTVAAAAVSHGGRIVNLGSTRDYVDATDLMNRLLSKEATLIGAHISTIDYPDRSPRGWSHSEERQLFARFVTEGTLPSIPYDIVHVARDGGREGVNGLYEAIARGRREPGAALLGWQ